MGQIVFDFLANLNFYDLLKTFFDNSYFDLVFPFLLVFSLLFTVLGKVKLFQNKDGIPLKSIVMIISLVVTFYSITFETSPGYTIGKLMMMLFPNISALTIGILALYIVGSIFGKNFFSDLFSNKHSSFIYMSAGGIGLGAIIFYVGIVMGFWNYSLIDQNSYWNFIIAMFLLILGIVFIIIGFLGVGTLFLFIFGTYIYNSGQGSILSYFIDPVVFIIVIVIILLTWLNSDKEIKNKLSKELNDQESAISRYEKEFGGKKLKPQDSRIHDILNENYRNNKETWKKKFGDDKY